MTNQLELEMRDLARRLYDEQIAHIFKVPEAMQQTPVDFFGFTRRGRAILIECKQVNRAYLPIGTSNGLAAHQWNALDLAHNCGAVSLIVWRRGDYTDVIEWDIFKLRRGDRKSIPWEAGGNWEEQIRDLLAMQA